MMCQLFCDSVLEHPDFFISAQESNQEACAESQM